MPAPPPELHVVDDPEVVIGDLLAEQASRGGSIVLTGGAGVGNSYERAAALQPDWSGVTVWWGDDRCVPPDDELSNYGLSKRTLLDNLRVPPAAAHRIRGELDPLEAAAQLDAALDGVVLDFLLLGLGSDGHCASLFAGSPQLDVEDRRAVSGPAKLDPFVERVTMTLPTLQAAKRIVFTVTGAAKVDAVRRSFVEEISREVPASLMRLAPVPVEVYLDAAAAGR